MTSRYSDEEIARLIAERKPLPPDYISRIQMKPKRGHKERELEILGSTGTEFRLILRQSNFNPLDFSVILACCPPRTNQIFRLIRYNGKSHEHTNLIEGRRFYSFHIHIATERYQELGSKEDSYAEPTDKFSDFQGALQCLREECGFELPDKNQLDLFKED